MRSSFRIRAAVVALAAGCMFTAATPAARAAAPEHLYVALAQQGSPQFQILRYPLQGGLPATNPDLTLVNAKPPMTVGADGTVYANATQTIAASIINVYPAGATTPSRQITLPTLLDYDSNQSLAVGPDSFLYAGYYSYISGGDTRSRLNSLDNASPMHGIAVYGPRANGYAQPLNLYTFPGMPLGPTVMVYGPEHQLLVGGYTFARGKGGHIFTLERPWHGPDIVSRLDTQEVFSIIIAGGEMFTLSAVGSLNPMVAVYRRGVHGSDKPFRTFTVPNYTYSMALIGNKLYCSTAAPILTAYLKTASGNPQPIYTRQYPGYSVFGVAAGP